MKKKKKIISLFMAAALAFQAQPVIASASYYDFNWVYSLYYDENGELYAGDICNYFSLMNSQKIKIPEKLGGHPVRSFDLAGQEIQDDATVEFYIPEGVKVENKEFFYLGISNNTKVILNYADGKTEVLQRKFDYSYSLEFDDLWDYELIEEDEGETKAVLTKYKGRSDNIEIPPEINGYPVVKLAATAFEDKSTYQSVYIVIPDTEIWLDPSDAIVKTEKSALELEDGCFDGLHSLHLEVRNLVHYHTGLYSYGEEVCSYSVVHDDDDFHDSLRLNEIYVYDGLSTVVIPDNVAGIPVEYLEESFLVASEAVDVILPDTIKSFKSGTFEYSHLRSVNIPKNVKVLPKCCFKNCYYLEEINGLENVQIISDEVFLDKFDKDYLTMEGSSNWRSLIDSDSMVKINYDIFDVTKPFIVTDTKSGLSYRIYTDPSDSSLSAKLIYAENDDTEFPTEFHGIPVTVELSSTIPNGVKVTIPEDQTILKIDSLNFYHDNLFAYPENKIDASYTTYEDYLRKDDPLQRNSIKKVEIKSKNIDIKENALSDILCSTYNFPGSVRIGMNAFRGNTSLCNLIFSGENSEIILGERSCDGFYNLKKVVFPEKCSKLDINTYALCNNSITELVFPEGDTKIGAHAFYGCSKLSSVVFNGPVDCGKSAFSNCTALKNVQIKSDASFKERTFERCVRLENIDYDITKPIIGTAFNGCKNLKMINGETLFNDDGTLKEEYRDFIEKNFKEADNVGFVNQYTLYRVKEILSEITNDNMTDLQVIKAIHDKICSMVDYDSENVDAPKNHTDASIFLNDTSVCDGYARAMNLFLKEAGFESAFVRTNDHAWVIVKVGEHFFHIDTTWDDDGDTISYDWFMKADDEIDGKESHSNWVMREPSTLHKSPWEETPACTSHMGDVNEDNIVDAKDASAILSSYAVLSVGDDSDIDTILADYNYDGKIDATDASAILNAYAADSVENET